MIISEIKVGDRCWFPCKVHPREDGTNATVKNTISTTPPSDIQTITITTDDGAVWIATPGLNVFWSRPKDEHMPRAPRRVRKTGWTNVYRTAEGFVIVGTEIHSQQAYAAGTAHRGLIDTIEISWTEVE